MMHPDTLPHRAEPPSGSTSGEEEPDLVAQLDALIAAAASEEMKTAKHTANDEAEKAAKATEDTAYVVATAEAERPTKLSDASLGSDVRRSDVHLRLCKMQQQQTNSCTSGQARNKNSRALTIW